MKRKLRRRSLAVPLLLGALSLPSQAALTIQYSNSPDGVVMSYSGTLNSNAFGDPEFSFFGNGVDAFISSDTVFNTTGDGFFEFDVFATPGFLTTAFPPFTGTASGLATPGSDFFFLSALNGGEVYLETSYVSGNLLVGNALFEDVTLEDLGASDGVYVGDITPGTDGNEVTMIVGDVPPDAVIPEITGSSVLLGMLGLSLFVRRRVQ